VEYLLIGIAKAVCTEGKQTPYRGPFCQKIASISFLTGVHFDGFSSKIIENGGCKNFRSPCDFMGCLIQLYATMLLIIYLLKYEEKNIF